MWRIVVAIGAGWNGMGRARERRSIKEAPLRLTWEAANAMVELWVMVVVEERLGSEGTVCVGCLSRDLVDAVAAVVDGLGELCVG